MYLKRVNLNFFSVSLGSLTPFALPSNLIHTYVECGPGYPGRINDPNQESSGLSVISSISTLAILAIVLGFVLLICLGVFGALYVARKGLKLSIPFKKPMEQQPTADPFQDDIPLIVRVSS